MIRYPLRPKRWVSLVEEESRTFLERAKERTATFREKKLYDEAKGIWSDIKRVYMEVQGFKCGFCERRLEGSRFGAIEHDVEHFRPKRNVALWPSARIQEDRGLFYDFPLGNDAVGDDVGGYYLLAYHIENYLIACKTCNTALKSDYFPIYGTRDTDGDDPRVLTKVEKPLLIYPLGAVDTAPETLITFRGVIPVPVASGRSWARRRAEVTIDFFQLAEREGLLQERAEIIVALQVAMRSLEDGDATTRLLAATLVNNLTARRSPHANCARAHREFAESDPEGAADLALEALGYLQETW